MSSEGRYSFSINSDGDATTEEAFIRSAINNGHILKWAYILQNNESIWRVVIIVDNTISMLDVINTFKPANESVRFLTYSSDVADELNKFIENDNYEVKSNFDLPTYITEARKGAMWEKIKSIFDPAMLCGLGIFIFFIIVAIKYGMSNTSHPWILPAIIGGIGVLYIVINLLAMRESKKARKFISGIPFIGGVHLLLAGLMSPCRWLALLCLLDFTIWEFIVALFYTPKKK